jgi:peptidoglycan/xylan/chitin deacetylase (PgdA/CDA1 family)
MVRLAASLGYGTALGSIYSFDHLIRSPRFHARFILGRVRPGSVVVLHDAQGRGTRTAATLEIVLPALREQGYDVVTLSELEEWSNVRPARRDPS